MADADEDRLLSIGQAPRSRSSKDVDGDSASDTDSDAAPDYRFLPGTTASAKKNALPARGTKDFEPNSTMRQSSALDTSREAMTDALSALRLHSTKKGEMIGVYFVNEVDWDGMRFDDIQDDDNDDDASGENTKKAKKATPLIKGEGRCVVVEKFTNTHVRTMGKSDRRNWIWLLPEEALFLLERGSLDIRYEVDNTSEEERSAGDESESREQDGTTGDQDHGRDDFPASSDRPTVVQSEDGQPRLKASNIPMSLQGAYAAFIGKPGLTLERYSVYANLKRAGYIVQRAPTWHGPVSRSTGDTQEVAVRSTSSEASSTQPISLVSRLIACLFRSAPKPGRIPCHNLVTGPLLSPGLFRNYYDVYRQLYLIPQYGHAEPPALTSPQDSDVAEDVESPSVAQSVSADPPLCPAFVLHKPSALQSYKKTSPPPPHFHVVVLPARQSVIPTSTQIGELLASMPDDPLPNADRKKFETRIKHGKRSVLLAVVDCGVISYVRFSSGGFEESLWQENERRGVGKGGKKGGGWGGRVKGKGKVGK